MKKTKKTHSELFNEWLLNQPKTKEEIEEEILYLEKRKQERIDFFLVHGYDDLPF